MGNGNNVVTSCIKIYMESQHMNKSGLADKLLKKCKKKIRKTCYSRGEITPQTGLHGDVSFSRAE